MFEKVHLKLMEKKYGVNTKNCTEVIYLRSIIRKMIGELSTDITDFNNEVTVLTNKINYYSSTGKGTQLAYLDEKLVNHKKSVKSLVKERKRRNKDLAVLNYQMGKFEGK